MKLLAVFIVALLALTAVEAADNGLCTFTSAGYKWYLCDLADFGPFFAKDQDGNSWTVSIAANMTCPSSIIGGNTDFQYAAACAPAGGRQNHVLGAYGVHSPKAMRWDIDNSKPSVMLRVQSVTTAYGWSGQYDLLNIIVHCNMDIRAAPINIKMTAGSHLENVPYLFELEHASGCGI